MNFGGGTAAVAVVHTGGGIATDGHMMPGLGRNAASVVHRPTVTQGERRTASLAGRTGAGAGNGNSVPHTTAACVAGAGGYITFQSGHIQSLTFSDYNRESVCSNSM